MTPITPPIQDHAGSALQVLRLGSCALLSNKIGSMTARLTTKETNVLRNGFANAFAK